MLQGLNIKYVLEENIRDTKRRQIFTKYRVCETPFSCTKRHTDKHDFHEKKKSVVYAGVLCPIRQTGMREIYTAFFFIII